MHTCILQGAVQKSDGALGVGLVTAVRSATVSLASGLLFCSPRSPSQCLTPLSAASALVVTLGGVAWVTAGRLLGASENRRSDQT